MFWVLLAASLLAIAFGDLMVLAGGMSDAPMAGADTASQGTVLTIFGIVVIILSCIARHYNILPV